MPQSKLTMTPTAEQKKDLLTPEQLKALIMSTMQMHGMIKPRGDDAAEQYEAAARFLRRAQEAMDDNDTMAANKLADKAYTITNTLRPKKTPWLGLEKK